MVEKNLIKLAKGSSSNTTKAPIAKKPVVKVDKKPITPAEERDIKAKAKVEELLHDVDLTPTKKDDLLEIDNSEDKGEGWLQEQVSRLSEENERLRSEAALAKEDYSKIFTEFQEIKSGVVSSDSNSELKGKIFQLFAEIQANLISMGYKPSGEPWFEIRPVAFLNRLIMFFPFLEKEKKF